MDLLRRVLLVTILFAIWLAPWPTAGADHVRMATETFVGPSLTGGANTLSGCLADANVGDVCFELLPHETSTDIVVETLSGQPVAALARLLDADLALLSWSGTFCGAMDNFGVAGGAYLMVQPLDPVNAQVSCAGEGVAMATTGLVRAGFH